MPARKNLLKFVVIGLLFLCSVFAYAAFKIPDYPQGYVNDYAGVLDSSQKAALNNVLRNYDIETTNQIFVGIFDSLGGHNLEDVSIRIAEKWKPGITNKDNGALLLLFLEDRKVRIEVGYGLEPLLTDVLAKAIITNEIAPPFRKGDYYAGITDAVSMMIKILSNDVSLEELKHYVYETTQSKPNPIFSLLFLIVFILFFIRHPFLALFLFSGGFSSGGRYSGSGGFFGGRGGSFGGGGASGSW